MASKSHYVSNTGTSSASHARLTHYSGTSTMLPSPFLLSLHLVRVTHKNAQTKYDPLCSEPYNTPSHQVWPLSVVVIITAQSSNMAFSPRLFTGDRRDSHMKAFTLSKSVGGHTPRYYSPAIQESLSLSSTMTTFSSVKSHFFWMRCLRGCPFSKCTQKRGRSSILEQRCMKCNPRW